MFSYVDRDRTWLKADQPEMQFSLFLRRSCRSCRGPQRRRRSRGREGSPRWPGRPAAAPGAGHLAPPARSPALAGVHVFFSMPSLSSTGRQYRPVPPRPRPILSCMTASVQVNTGARGHGGPLRARLPVRPGRAVAHRRAPQRGAGAGSRLGLWPGHGAGGGRIEPGRRPPGGGAERG